jgi:hypothetical protein
MAEKKPKLGSQHLAGMARKGMTEVGQYLPAFNNAGTHVTEDQAIWPNQTPGEIAQARGNNGSGAEQDQPASTGQAAQEEGGVDAHGHDPGTATGQRSEKVAQRLARMKGNGQSRGR